MATSHTPSGFVPSAPLNITSSILPLRRILYFCSPSTHRIASTILVFPHPLGPTTVVMPCPSFMTSLLAKDLKPCIFNSDIYTKTGLDAVGEFTRSMTRILPKVTINLLFYIQKLILMNELLTFTFLAIVIINKIFLLIGRSISCL